MSKRPNNGRKKPGPKEDRLKLEGDWRKAAKKALQKKRPKKWAEGRPETQ